MDQHILTQLLEAALEMRADVATIKARQETTVEHIAESKASFKDLVTRLEVVESNVAEAAMTWKITKRIAIGLVTLAVSLITFNWAGLKAGWLIIFHG